MSDPVTVGGVVVTALTMAAETMVKTSVGEAAKDAYKALKTKVAAWAGPSAELLEQVPDSPKVQAVVAAAVDAQSAEDRTDVERLAAALLDALEERDRQGPIGIDIGRLHAARVSLGRITVTDGTGFRAAEVNTPGTFSLDEVNVGAAPGKPMR